MIIRQEQKQDYNEIRKLVKIAFENAEHTDGNEYKLVDKLRTSKDFVQELTLVAENETGIIGHILFTKVNVGNEVGLALAPLSVHPKFQKIGIGTMLMKKAHGIAKNLGYNFVIVLGSEKYYPKIGYEVASKYGIKAPFEVPDENFMVLFLNDNKKDLKGIVKYTLEMLED